MESITQGVVGREDSRLWKLGSLGHIPVNKLFDPKGRINGIMEDEMSKKSKCLNTDSSFGRLRYGS